jgi:hypothetical protein
VGGFDGIGDALRQRRLGLVEALLAGGDQRIDQLLLVDALGLGDLGEALAVLELGAELLGGEAQRLGGDLEADAASAPASIGLARCGRTALVAAAGGGGRGGGVLGPRRQRVPQGGADQGASGEGRGHGDGGEGLLLAHDGSPC